MDSRRFGAWSLPPLLHQTHMCLLLASSSLRTETRPAGPGCLNHANGRAGRSGPREKSRRRKSRRRSRSTSSRISLTSSRGIPALIARKGQKNRERKARPSRVSPLRPRLGFFALAVGEKRNEGRQTRQAGRCAFSPRFSRCFVSLFQARHLPKKSALSYLLAGPAQPRAPRRESGQIAPNAKTSDSLTKTAPSNRSSRRR